MTRLEVTVTALAAALAHPADAFDAGVDLGDCAALADLLGAAGGHGVAVRRGDLRESCDESSDVSPVRAWDVASDVAASWVFRLAVVTGETIA